MGARVCETECIDLHLDEDVHAGERCCPFPPRAPHLDSCPPRLPGRVAPVASACRPRPTSIPRGPRPIPSAVPPPGAGYASTARHPPHAPTSRTHLPPRARPRRDPFDEVSRTAHPRLASPAAPGPGSGGATRPRAPAGPPPGRRPPGGRPARGVPMKSGGGFAGVGRKPLGGRGPGAEGGRGSERRLASGQEPGRRPRGATRPRRLQGVSSHTARE